jgi:phosphoribosylformimino-5-aminoimidazole carboxamide ribotide isomerase
MRFRPCIDLRNGRVVQIIGSSLSDQQTDQTITNFEAVRPAEDFACIYQADDLPGGHVISLGPGNQAAALRALRAYPGGMQVGGGITPENAGQYLDAGASHIIVTAYIFNHGRIDMTRLARLVKAVGRSRLVLDLSCRKKGDAYWVVSDRWQTFTEVRIDRKTLNHLAEFCDEFFGARCGCGGQTRRHGVGFDPIIGSMVPGAGHLCGRRQGTGGSGSGQPPGQRPRGSDHRLRPGYLRRTGAL